MKKKIYICMSILIVFILSLSIVRANTMDTYGMSVKEMDSFASEHLSVDQMKRLSSLYRKRKG